MGGQISKQLQRRKVLSLEKITLFDLQDNCGNEFPGSDYCPSDSKNWMHQLDPQKLQLHNIVWPGTHDSATNKIGVRFVSRPFARCQSLSIYRQLARGARLLDIRVQEDHRVCHGILKSYNVDVVIDDIKRFLSETQSEIIILEIRTEFGHEDPPEFDEYLVEHLGVPDSSRRSRLPEDGGGAASEARDLRLEAEEIGSAQGRWSAVERRAPERPLDRHGLALDQIREQHEAFEGAAASFVKEVLLQGGEHGAAAAG
ncbi:hypothetical protein ACLOJK_012710 [Asimina triloba]